MPAIIKQAMDIFITALKVITIGIILKKQIMNTLNFHMITQRIYGRITTLPLITI